MCPWLRSAAGDCLLCSCARDLLYFWPILVALLSPKPHVSVPALHLKRCHELHLLIMLKVHSHGPPLPQVSLPHACLAPGTLPCYLPSRHTWFPSPSQPLSFTPPCLLCLEKSTEATAPQCCPACPTTFLSSGPWSSVLNPHWHHTSSQYSRPVSPVFSLSADFELSPTVLTAWWHK